MRHIPTESETQLLLSILEYHRSEYVVLRITQTMLKKSIIDASSSIYSFFQEQGLFDFDYAVDGEKTYLQCEILGIDSKIHKKKVSFYRPKAKPQKPGDPRFWPYGFKGLVKKDDLVYLGAINGHLVIIPLINEIASSRNLKNYFGDKSSLISPQLEKVMDFLKEYKFKWVESISPRKKHDKDVGETFEHLLGLSANSDKSADLDGELELKTKRINSKTDDTLFCKVPDKSKTPLVNVRNIILEYGYPSRDSKRPDYIDLFVTVTTKPNPQGLYHEVNRDEGQLEQYFVQDDTKVLVAVWTFDVLKKALEVKHPSTAWIGAEEKKEQGKIFFRYCQLDVTQQPLFQNFLLSIESGEIVFEWRGGQHPEKGKGKPIDYGHAFRLKHSAGRGFLFGSNEKIEF